MAHKFIWQQATWPSFRWDSSKILQVLGRARQLQGRIMAQAELIGLEQRAEMVVEEAFATSAIEGERLDRSSIRSSVARRLGLPTAGLPTPGRYVDGLVDMLLDATNQYSEPLTVERLYGWHASLFPTGYSGIQKIQVAQWRSGEEPMQVVSGPIGREKIHYVAPPSKMVNREIKLFLDWWNSPPAEIDGLVRAAIAHFWFVTIHPFEDGNGRISRAITDMALAQDEQSSRRLYSLSQQIIRERDAYYDALQISQQGSLDVTDWLKWFLEMYSRAIEVSSATIQHALKIAQFWQVHGKKELNERQIKVLHKILEAWPHGFEGGINNRKYVSITRTSRETAKRDLADLEKKGILVRLPGGGRSVSYGLSKDFTQAI